VPLEEAQDRFLAHAKAVDVSGASPSARGSAIAPDGTMLTTTSCMTTLGKVLVCTGPILMVLPIVLPLVFIPLGKLLGFEVLGESGMVEYHGQLLQENDEHGPLVHSFGDFLAAMGMLPWMLFFSLPVGGVLLIAGGANIAQDTD
jgi:hypothetical protein